MTFRTYVIEGEPGVFYWALLGVGGCPCEPHYESGCEFSSYADALNAAEVAQAAAECLPYESEAVNAGFVAMVAPLGQ